MSEQETADLKECLEVIRAFINAQTPREHNAALVRAHALLAKMGVGI